MILYFIKPTITTLRYYVKIEIQSSRDGVKKKKPVAVAVPAERPSEYFAKYVFNKEKNVPLSAEQGVCQTDGCD